MITQHTTETLRAFELRVKAKWEAGELASSIHLCGGNEQQLIDIFQNIGPADWIYSTHRNHFHALLKGVPEERVEGLIHFGQSMFVFDRTVNFLSTAILAGGCCIAAGIAWDIKQRGGVEKVWCFLGDGSEENGQLFQAAMFVEANDLPCAFIIEDNGWQMDTPKTERRGKKETTLYPLDHLRCVHRYHYERIYPHAGSGVPITLKPEAIERIRPAA